MNRHRLPEWCSLSNHTLTTATSLSQNLPSIFLLLFHIYAILLFGVFIGKINCLERTDVRLDLLSLQQIALKASTSGTPLLRRLCCYVSTRATSHPVPVQTPDSSRRASSTTSRVFVPRPPGTQTQTCLIHLNLMSDCFTDPFRYAWNDLLHRDNSHVVSISPAEHNVKSPSCILAGPDVIIFLLYGSPLKCHPFSGAHILSYPICCMVITAQLEFRTSQGSCTTGGPCIFLRNPYVFLFL